MSGNVVKADNSDRKYFTMTPHIVLALCRDPFDFTVWSVIKTVAGEIGECILSTDDLAGLAGCSHGKLVAARAHLLRVGLLAGELRRDPGYPQPVWHLSVPDLWPRNIAWRAELATWREFVTAVQKSRHQVTAVAEEPSPGDGGGSPGDGSTGLRAERPSPHDGMPSCGDAIKEVPIEASSVKEKRADLLDRTPEEVWAVALSQLRLQMTKSTFETWVRDTHVVAFAPPATFAIGVPSQYAHDWLALRLRPTIKRTLSGLAGRVLEPIFVVQTGGNHGT